MNVLYLDAEHHVGVRAVRREGGEVVISNASYMQCASRVAETALTSDNMALVHYQYSTSEALHDWGLMDLAHIRRLLRDGHTLGFPLVPFPTYDAALMAMRLGFRV